MDRSLSVLHILRGRERGGIGTLWLHLAQELQKRGVDVSALILQPGELARRAEAQGIRVTVPSQNGAGRLVWVQAIVKRIRESGMTMIHTHGIGSNTYGRLGKLLSGGIPLMTSIHADMFSELQGVLGGVRSRVYYLIDRSTRFLTDLFIANSHGSARRSIEQGVPKEKIRVVHNGIPIGPIPEPADRFQRRKDLGIPDDARIIGTVGRLTAAKNQALLIECVPELLRTTPGLYVLIVGDGYLRPALGRRAEALGVGNHVLFCGWQEDVYEWIRLMDVFVLPSAAEGFGMAALEAMKCEKPVVATRVGGIPEIVQEGASGFLVAPQVEEMTRAIRSLLLDPLRAESMGKKGRSILEASFSAQRMAEEMMTLYQDVYSRRYHHANSST